MYVQWFDVFTSTAKNIVMREERVSDPEGLEMRTEAKNIIMREEHVIMRGSEMTIYNKNLSVLSDPNKNLWW